MKIKLKKEINYVLESCKLASITFTNYEKKAIDLFKDECFFNENDEINEKIKVLNKLHNDLFKKEKKVLKNYMEYKKYFSVRILPGKIDLAEFVFNFLDETMLDNFSVHKFKIIFCMILKDYVGAEIDVVESLEELENVQPLEIHEIFKLINEKDMSSEDKVNILDMYQNIDNSFDDIIKIIRAGVDILKEYDEVIQSIYSVTYDKYKEIEGKSIKELGRFAVSKYVDFDLTDSIDVNVCNFYISIIGYNHFTITVIPDMKFGMNLLIGVFFEELTMFANDQENRAKTSVLQLKALSDLNRYKIMKLLIQKSYYAKELAEILNLTPATLSHHMEILSSAGLLKTSTDGRKLFYKINDENISLLIGDLDSFLNKY